MIMMYLLDDFKVCGIGMRRHGEIDYTTIHIGINTNLENIKLICTKPMKKVPKGLGEYGLTSEEVKNWAVDFCRHYHMEDNIDVAEYK